VDESRPSPNHLLRAARFAARTAKIRQFDRDYMVFYLKRLAGGIATVAVAAISGGLTAAFAMRATWSWPTFWSAAQAITTLLAFCAAAVYAWIARRQTQLIAEQVRLIAAESRVAHKPVVVTIREENADGPCDYRVRNVGRGTAINVWYVTPRANDEWRTRSLGALGPGEARFLPKDINLPLVFEFGTFRHVIAAEGIAHERRAGI
jgi:hypothetical protein